jgi:hypothetical protein
MPACSGRSASEVKDQNAFFINFWLHYQRINPIRLPSGPSYPCRKFIGSISRAGFFNGRVTKLERWGLVVITALVVFFSANGNGFLELLKALPWLK